jgi:transcriptional regulator with PAS, ATPase and Fis domain
MKLSQEIPAQSTRISQGKEIQNTIGDSSIVDYEEDAFAETLSISEVNADLIKKALEKNNGKRKLAAAELGISERTLYRKIKELNLDL